MKTTRIILLTILITGLVIVGGIYYYHSQKAKNEQNEFKKQTTIPQKKTPDLKEAVTTGVKDTAKETTITTEDETTNSIPSFTNNPAVTTCDFWKNQTYGNVHTDIEGDDAAGTLEIQGRILSRFEKAAFSDTGAKVTKVYLTFSKPASNSQQIFYDHYMAVAERNNFVNRIDGEQLLFRLGFKENSSLTSSANISNNLRNRLVSLIDTMKTVRLKITIPIYPGMGVGDDFSFACDISE